MTSKYFGTDGVRGKVGETPITPDLVMKIGYAAGKVLAGHRVSAERPAVLIGKDTRISGYMLDPRCRPGFPRRGGYAAGGTDAHPGLWLTSPAPSAVRRRCDQCVA